MKIIRSALMSIAAFLLMAAALISNTSAAQMYRCGNIYQDHPCNSGQQGKSIRPLGAGAATDSNRAPAASGNQAADVTCTQRAGDSQKIVWSREAGLTLEEQLSAEKDPRKQKLIQDVYRVRGTAPEVRRRIEAECRAEMEEQARLLELQRAMTKSGVTPQQASATAAGVTGQQAASASDARNEAQRAASAKDAKTSQCNGINARIESVQSGLRKGGNLSTMENLNQQMRTLQQEQQNAGC